MRLCSSPLRLKAFRIRNKSGMKYLLTRQSSKKLAFVHRLWRRKRLLKVEQMSFNDARVSIWGEPPHLYTSTPSVSVCHVNSEIYEFHLNSSSFYEPMKYYCYHKESIMLTFHSLAFPYFPQLCFENYRFFLLLTISNRWRNKTKRFFAFFWLFWYLMGVLYKFCVSGMKNISK